MAGLSATGFSGAELPADGLSVDGYESGCDGESQSGGRWEGQSSAV